MSSESEEQLHAVINKLRSGSCFRFEDYQGVVDCLTYSTKTSQFEWDYWSHADPKTKTKTYSEEALREALKEQGRLLKRMVKWATDSL